VLIDISEGLFIKISRDEKHSKCGGGKKTSKNQQTSIN